MSLILSRRALLQSSLAAFASGPLAAQDTPAESFSFAHLTDMHVQSELGAADGFRQCIEHVNRLSPRPDFVITGGDLIMDALAVDHDRIGQQWRLFDESLKTLELPVHHTIGNHDVAGWSPTAKLARDHVDYGKRIFADRYGQGRTYRSFDHRGWHFILLDSIGLNSISHDYYGRIDDAQLDWLKQDLEHVGRQRPIVIVTHIPFYSTWHQVSLGPEKPLGPKALITNSPQVQKLLKPHNVRLVLSGHGHVRERIEVAHQVHIQSGAVSGLWWKGPVHGDAEAYGVVSCRGNAFDYRYESYGWQARKPS